ncbi:MAG: hypothetical protein OEY49_18485, partial [Candidatus Heimdallarchaeota archaeon]|nr:hypothetical protein [Candidatus Heimdallarchaeota archaeon]
TIDKKKPVNLHQTLGSPQEIANSIKNKREALLTSSDEPSIEQAIHSRNSKIYKYIKPNHYKFIFIMFMIFQLILFLGGIFIGYLNIVLIFQIIFSINSFKISNRIFPYTIGSFSLLTISTLYFIHDIAQFFIIRSRYYGQISNLRRKFLLIQKIRPIFKFMLSIIISFNCLYPFILSFQLGISIITVLTSIIFLNLSNQLVESNFPKVSNKPSNRSKLTLLMLQFIFIFILIINIIAIVNGIFYYDIFIIWYSIFNFLVILSIRFIGSPFIQYKIKNFFKKTKYFQFGGLTVLFLSSLYSTLTWSFSNFDLMIPFVLYILFFILTSKYLKNKKIESGIKIKNHLVNNYKNIYYLISTYQILRVFMIGFTYLYTINAIYVTMNIDPYFLTILSDGIFGFLLLILNTISLLLLTYKRSYQKIADIEAIFRQHNHFIIIPLIPSTILSVRLINTSTFDNSFEGMYYSIVLLLLAMIPFVIYKLNRRRFVHEEKKRINVISE